MTNGNAPAPHTEPAPPRVKPGEAQVAAVAKLAADLADPASKNNFKVSPPEGPFKLTLEVFDPETSLLFYAAHPARRDIGAPAVLMTVDQVVATVLSTRTHAQQTGKL